MNIVVVSQNYPTKTEPNKGAFVYNLAQEFVRRGNNVAVVAPIKIWDLFKRNSHKEYGSELCKVYRPIYITFSNKKILGINMFKVSQLCLSLSVYICCLIHLKKWDYFYCHFFYNALAVFPFVKKYNKKLIVASGESNYDYLNNVNADYFKEVINYAKKTICVSGVNYSFLKNYVAEEKLTLVPNTVDFNLFKELPHKKSLRTEYAIAEDKFIIGFIGHFIERKGPNRLLQAVSKVDVSNNVQVVLIGKGDLDFTIPNLDVKIIEPVPNSILPELINTFDLFVLPTLSEGHCNVINEVKACIVPIISSAGTSVESQLVNGKTGFLIDPLNIEEISNTISSLLKDSQMREKMRENLRDERNSNSFDLKDRAIKILSNF